MLASSIAGLFAVFPQAIIGAMMFLVGLEMVKFAKDVSFNRELAVLAVTALVSIFTNMAYGFLAGLGAHYLLVFLQNRKKEDRPADG